jgi:hypothetical protein
MTPRHPETNSGNHTQVLDKTGFRKRAKKGRPEASIKFPFI